MTLSLIMGYILYFRFSTTTVRSTTGKVKLRRRAGDWMVDGKRAKVWIIVSTTPLQFVGKTMIVMIAGFQGIPESHDEAAAIDGARLRAEAGQEAHITPPPRCCPPSPLSVILNLGSGDWKLLGSSCPPQAAARLFLPPPRSTLINYLWAS